MQETSQSLSSFPWRSIQRAITCPWKLASAGLACQAARPRTAATATAAAAAASSAGNSKPKGPGQNEVPKARKASKAANPSHAAGCMPPERTGPILTSRHGPPKDDQAAVGRGVCADWAEGGVPRPGRTPADSPGLTPGTGTGVPAATARASVPSSAGDEAGTGPR